LFLGKKNHGGDRGNTDVGSIFGGGEHALETLKKQNFIHKNKITKKQKKQQKKEKHC